MKKILLLLILLPFHYCFSQFNLGTTYSNHSDLNASRYQPSALDLGEKTIQIGINYYLWMGNNNFNYSNIRKAYKEDDINFLSHDAKPSNLLGVGQDYQLFGFAYQYKSEDNQNFVFGFSIVDKFAMNFRYTDKFLRLALGGNKQFAGQKIGLGPTTINANYSREYVVSGAFPLYGDTDNGLRLGIRGKFIQGLGNIYMPKGNASLYTEPNGRYLEMDFDYAIYTSGLSNFSFLKTKGLGVGLDAGLTWFISSDLEIAGSILDLGTIRYKEDTKSYKKTGTGKYEGLVIDNLFGGTKSNIDTSNAIIDAERAEGIEYGMPLGTKLSVEIEYKVGKKERTDGSLAYNSVFLTYFQGLNNSPGATTRPFVSMGYNHDFTNFFDAGGLISVGGFNTLSIGTFVAFDIKETVKLGIGSDNLTGLLFPRKGTGIDISANFSLSF